MILCSVDGMNVGMIKFMFFLIQIFVNVSVYVIVSQMGCFVVLGCKNMIVEMIFMFIVVYIYGINVFVLCSLKNR